MPSENVSDTELVKQIKHSDVNAFQLLYYRYSENLFRFLWRKMGNTETAKEFVQEIFIRVWQQRHHLDDQLSIKAYLYRIASNLAIDHLRKKITHQRYFTDEINKEPSYTFNPDSHDLQEHIQNAIESLPKAQYTVFTLSKFDGLSYAEIAETLNISIKTVENHMSKALKKLRELLSYLLTSLLALLPYIF